MANWTDCEISFTGDKAKEALKRAEAQEFAEFYVTDDDDDQYVRFTLSGRYKGPSDWFTDTCSELDLVGLYQDAESGNDFYHRIEFEDGAVVGEIENDYFCDENIEWQGHQYFIESYAECFEHPLECEEIAEKLSDSTEEKAELGRYFTYNEEFFQEPTDEIVTELERLLDEAPLIGSTEGSAKVICIIGDLYIVEAERQSVYYTTHSYKTMSFDNGSKMWVEKEIVPGTILNKKTEVPVQLFISIDGNLETAA
jgi:hypothetical protein